MRRFGFPEIVTLIGLALITVVVVRAQEPEPVVLTPTKLYDLIEDLQHQVTTVATVTKANLEGLRKRDDGISIALQNQNKRLKLLEDFLGDANTKGALAGIIESQKYKISVLERKVAGMQKQITILHAIVKPLKKDGK